MSRKSAVLHRTAAGIGALALVFAGAVAMGTAANAVTGPAPDQPGAPTAGTLTINKYSGAHTPTPDPADLLDGVEFTVTQVGHTVGGACVALDLTDADNWDGLPELFDSAPTAPADPLCLTGTQQVESTVDGQAIFDLGVGVYYVVETGPSDHPIVSPVPNFYVSIPTSNGASGDGWNYDVVADPKNQLSEAPSKVISDRPDALVIGSNVTWTLTVPIPTFNNDETFTTASMTDTLPAGLAYTSSTIEVGGETLTEGDDYTVTGATTWSFGATGLAALDANQGGDITITLVTQVTTVSESGHIVNDDYESSFNGTVVPGEDFPHTYWGQLNIQKNDNSTPARGLEGAEFQVFEMGASCPAEAPGSGAVATGVSDDNGVVQWTGVTPASPLGLWVANSNAGELTDPSKDYCVYETVIPAGHTVGTSITNPVSIEPGTVNVANFTVVNNKKPGPALPLTGSTGTLAMTIGGIAIIALGAGTLLVSRRHRKGSL
ncbi:SpaH/EbpB family LPXTG-anchored major pilin [Leucobacter sp. GX0328]